MVFDGPGVVFYIGLLLNLEVQSIICNPIFITKMYFKRVFLACNFPLLFTNQTRSWIGAKEIDQKRE